MFRLKQLLKVMYYNLNPTNRLIAEAFHVYSEASPTKFNWDFCQISSPGFQPEKLYRLRLLRLVLKLLKKQLSVTAVAILEIFKGKEVTKIEPLLLQTFVYVICRQQKVTER